MGGTVRGDEEREADAGKPRRTRTGPRHAAPKRSVLTRLQMPAGKAIALAAMPTAVLMGMGLTPQLASADPRAQDFKPGPCVTQPDEAGDEQDKDKDQDKNQDESQDRDRGKDTEDPKGEEPGTPESPDGEKPRDPAGGDRDDQGRDDTGRDEEKPGDEDTGDTGQDGTTPAPDPTGDDTTPKPAPTGPTDPADEATESPDPVETDPESPLDPLDPLDPLGLGDPLEDALNGEDDEHAGQPGQDGTEPGSDSTDPTADPTDKAGDSAADTADEAKDEAEDKAADRAEKDEDPGDEPSDGTSPAPSPTTTPSSDSTPTPDPSPKPGDGAEDEGEESYPCPTYDAEAYENAPTEPTASLLPDEPWTLKTSRLGLHGLAYDGIVEVKTYSGKVKKVLKFTAKGVDIKDLHQLVKGPGGTTTHVAGREGSTSTIRNGTVTMYTEELSGKLLGIIPVTFSPKAPPPLTLPELFFTEVTVVQAGQFGGDLTIPGMRLYQTEG
ncbi:hydrogenase expression protein HypF [Streptomyces sp. SAJ15]|uniref:hydrogenase expression protein HypF n=1 Tax=Streptomyces sp. SAJ15 TaxID=2011095 RepID=UPI00118587F3|nr:hydrogenase expression protein HypF [Streptomyces sp. SAJ15]TVL94216.1 hydrogenase expression protein HypF [Streptomyces sp. SAJ15]